MLSVISEQSYNLGEELGGLGIRFRLVKGAESPQELGKGLRSETTAVWLVGGEEGAGGRMRMFTAVSLICEACF